MSSIQREITNIEKHIDSLLETKTFLQQDKIKTYDSEKKFGLDKRIKELTIEIDEGRERILKLIQQSNSIELLSKTENTSFAHETNNLSEISEETPLLIGCLCDFSINVFDSIYNNSDIYKKLLSNLLTRAINSCTSKNHDKVLKKILLFCYGYGFDKSNHNINDFFSKLGLDNKVSFNQDRVRDLFLDDKKPNLSPTPNIVELNDNIDKYKEVIIKYLPDILGTNNSLYEGLVKVNDRFEKEFSRPLYQYPMLILLSTGKFNDSSYIELEKVIRSIKNLGVQVVCLYLTSDIVVEEYTLFEKEENNWTSEAKLLFRLSSSSKDSSDFYQTISEMAIKNNWNVAKNHKFFFQINNSKILEDVVKLLFGSKS